MGKRTIKRIYDSEGNLISRECSYCHEIKPVSKFHEDKRRIDGLCSQCKECRRRHYNKGKKKQIKRNYDDKGNLISKECCCCHEIKSVSKFSVDKRAKDGFRSECNECSKKYSKKYYQENKEKKREYGQKNKDKIKERKKEHRSKKIQETLQQIKIEVESNPEKYNYREGEKIYGVIYLVHNIKSNKYYVGQTTIGFDIRYQSGWLYVHGRKKDVKPDLELYGENSFEYIKLFKVAHSQYELDKLEAYYIDYYDSYENGYNETRGNIFTNRGKEEII